MLAENMIMWEKQFEKKGIQKGRIEERVEILETLIAERFGQEAVSQAVKKRLRTASPEKLALWTKRILKVKTLSELFS